MHKAEWTSYPIFDSPMQNDSFTNCHVYFQNCVVCVRKDDDLKQMSYVDLQYSIWESQIIPRSFSMANEKEIKEGEFQTFVSNVCGKDEYRIKSLCSAIGYCIHSKYDPANAKAIVFYDEKIPDRYDMKEGRTGKSLSANAIGRFKGNFVSISGGRMKRDNRFIFQKL